MKTILLSFIGTVFSMSAYGYGDNAPASSVDFRDVRDVRDARPIAKLGQLFVFWLFKQ
jgi:hypothetical protein